MLAAGPTAATAVQHYSCCVAVPAAVGAAAPLQRVPPPPRRGVLVVCAARNVRRSDVQGGVEERVRTVAWCSGDACRGTPALQLATP
jgi:hypothetical protein